jgi:hypothetical protein
MFERCFKIGIVIILGMCLGAHASTPASPQKGLGAIADAVSDGTIQEVDILSIPKAAFTKVEVTPEILAKDFQCKVVLRDLKLSRSGLTRAIGNTKASSDAHPVGLRRGVLFLDGTGHTRFAVYLDSFGQGSVDGMKAALSGEFVQWIEDHLPEEYW